MNEYLHTPPIVSDFEALPAESYLSFTSDRITLSCKSNESVEMLYENKDRSVQHKSLSIIYTGEYFEHGATIELRKRRTLNSYRGHVKCVKRKSKEVLWTWNYDTDYSCQCTWPLVKKGRKISVLIQALIKVHLGAPAILS